MGASFAHDRPRDDSDLPVRLSASRKSRTSKSDPTIRVDQHQRCCNLREVDQPRCGCNSDESGSRSIILYTYKPGAIRVCVCANMATRTYTLDNVSYDQFASFARDFINEEPVEQGARGDCALNTIIEHYTRCLQSSIADDTQCVESRALCQIIARNIMIFAQNVRVIIAVPLNISRDAQYLCAECLLYVPDLGHDCAESRITIGRDRAQSQINVPMASRYVILNDIGFAHCARIFPNTRAILESVIDAIVRACRAHYARYPLIVLPRIYRSIIERDSSAQYVIFFADQSI